MVSSKYLGRSSSLGNLSGEYKTASGSVRALCLGEQTARQRLLKKILYIKK